MTRVADTSALYALFSEDARFQERATRDLRDPDPIMIPTEVLAETVDLLAYRFRYPAAAKALDFLLRLPHVGIADRVEVSAVKAIYDRARGALSLADAFVVQTCLALGADALAYDEAIRRALRRRSP